MLIKNQTIYLLPENVLHTIDTEFEKSRSLSTLDDLIGKRLVNLKNRRDVIVSAYEICDTRWDDDNTKLTKMTLELNTGHRFNYLNQKMYIKSAKVPRENDIQDTFIPMYDMMIKYDDTLLPNVFKDTNIFNISSESEISKSDKEFDIKDYYPPILYSLFINSESDLTRHGTKDIRVAMESEDKIVHNNSFSLIKILENILGEDFINGYKKYKKECEIIYDFTVNEKARDLVNMYIENHGLITKLPELERTNVHPLYSLLFRNDRKTLFNLLYNSIGSELSRLGNSENSHYDNQLTIRNEKYLQAAAKLLLYCGKNNCIRSGSIFIGNMKEDVLKIPQLTSQDHYGPYYKIHLENDLEEDNGILVDGLYIRDNIEE